MSARVGTPIRRPGCVARRRRTSSTTPPRALPGRRLGAQTLTDLLPGGTRTVASDEKPPARALAFRRSGALALLLGLFLAYLLTTSRERPWSDATPIWEVADSLISRG